MIEAGKNTEEKILEAAKNVFVRKGLEGSRMQEIADEAGINKALLHYYFRTKDKLFDSVFMDAYQKVIPNIIELMNSELPLFRKIELFAFNYMNMFKENPFIPGFLMNELNRDPSKVVGFIRSQGVDPKVIAKQIDKEVENGTIDPVDPYQLIVNMLSLCIFPFVAAPILENIIFDGNKEKFANFLEARIKEIPVFVINAIRKK